MSSNKGSDKPVQMYTQSMEVDDDSDQNSDLDTSGWAFKEGLYTYMISKCTVKPVLSSHSKEDQKLVFKTDYRLMQVQSIVECFKRAFCNTFDLH